MVHWTIADFSSLNFTGLTPVTVKLLLFTTSCMIPPSVLRIRKLSEGNVIAHNAKLKQDSKDTANKGNGPQLFKIRS